MNQVANRLMSSVIQAALWSLQRIDYYFNSSVVTLNNPDFYANPYATYNTLRERGPVLRSMANRGWIVNGFDEVTELLRDKRISSDLRKNAFFSNLIKFAANGIEVPLIDNPSMLNQDQPDHTRLRKLVAQGFTHKYIQSLAPKIEQLVDELLAKIPEDAEEFDVMQSLAKPLPAIVIAEMMGVPSSERHQFELWSAALLGLVEIQDPSMIKKAAVANAEMRDYIARLTEQKRQSPGQDLISQLIAAEEDGDKLTLDELYSTCILLLTAGHETTTRLIGNCLYHLLRNPQQMNLAQNSAEDLASALEESLRFEPPVQITLRFVNEPMQFRGRHFKRGQTLLLCIAGANRDSTANIDPDKFDLKRERISHVSFGHGIHLCLGMSLARLEGQIALNKLFSRYPRLVYAEDKPAWGTNDFFRGLETLTVKI